MRKTYSIKRQRTLLVLTVMALAICTVALGVAGRRLFRPKPNAQTPPAPRTAPHLTRESAPLNPQSSSQFDLSRNVIAGGGGASTNGGFRIDGTAGQQTAGTTSSNGQFSVTAGFWQPQSGSSATPTPTPSPSPTPTATPTPPVAPTIFVEEGTNLLGAVNSVTFVRGPFTLTDNHNFSSDHRTRIIFFTTSLGFAQPSLPDISILSVEVGGFTVPVESVGPASFPGMAASYIVFRLPNLPPGDWPLGIRLNSVSSINSPLLKIAPPPG